MTSPEQRISTGVQGLDEIAYGGLLPQRAYLVRGGPGGGKTTLSLHFLAAETEGTGLYVSLGENGGQVRAQSQQLKIPDGKIQFADGVHFMRLTDRGMQVFPRLIPDNRQAPCDPVTLSTGVEEIDALLGGGN